MASELTLLVLVGLLGGMLSPTHSAPADGVRNNFLRELEDFVERVRHNREHQAGAKQESARVAGPAVVGDCGLLSGESLRILGGSKASLKQLPWQVRLGIVLGANGEEGQCGGTIISDQWVVTAAHCVELPDSTFMTDTSKMYLNFGEIDSEHYESTEIEVNPAKIIVHPGRRIPPSAEEQTPNDLILVKLKEKLIFNDYINAACLPDSSEQFPAGTECIVSGFGATGDPTAEGSPALKYVSVNIIDDATCSEAIGGVFTDDFLCAGRSEPEIVDACQGDSGGPLVCKSNGRYTLEGVVSFGGECATLEESNGVYSSIPHHLAWIKKTMATN